MILTKRSHGLTLIVEQFDRQRMFLAFNIIKKCQQVVQIGSDKRFQEIIDRINDTKIKLIPKRTIIKLRINLREKSINIQIYST